MSKPCRETTTTAEQSIGEESFIGFFGLPRPRTRESASVSDCSGRGRGLVASNSRGSYSPFRRVGNKCDDEFELSLSDLAAMEERREKAKEERRKNLSIAAIPAGTPYAVSRREARSELRLEGEPGGSNGGTRKNKQKRQMGMRSFLRSPTSSLSASTESESLAVEHASPYEDDGIPSPAFPLAPASVSRSAGRIAAQENTHRRPSTLKSSELSHVAETIEEGKADGEQPSNETGDNGKASGGSLEAGRSLEEDDESVTSESQGSAADENIEGRKRLKSVSFLEKIERRRRRQEGRLRIQCNHAAFAERNHFSPLGSPPMVDCDKLQTDALKPKFNVLTDLVRRTSYPARRKMGPTPRLRYFAHCKKWGMSDTVELESAGVGATTCMDFDSQGVLLATADTQGVVRVYDFDEVNAADVRIRNGRCRVEAASIPSRQTEEESASVTAGSEGSDIGGPASMNSGADIDVDGLVQPTKSALVRPIISFCAKLSSSPSPGGPHVTCIKWNPYNEDELAVSFLTQPEVCIYDVASCSSAPSIPQSVRLMDGQLRRGHQRGEGTSFLMFLQSRQRSVSRVLTGGTRGTVRLWTSLSFSHGLAPQHMQQKVKLMWGISPFRAMDMTGCDRTSDDEGVSDMVPVGHGYAQSSTELILIGGTRGSIALLDIKRCTRKAFSTAVTPTILRCWDVTRMILGHRLAAGARMPSRNWMGVKKMCLWGERRSGFKSSMPTLVLSIILVANCGWVFEMSLDVDAKQMKISIVHKTKHVTYLNSDHDEVAMDNRTLSFTLPRYPTPSCELRGGLLCLADVRPQHLILAQKDNRVLGNASLPDSVGRDGNNDGIIILDAKQGSQTTSNQEKHLIARIRVNGPAISLIVHPSSEWIVLGSEGSTKVQLIRLRGRGGSLP